MANVTIADRVLETTTTTGTGTITLNGAVAQFQSFSQGVGIGNETFYAITDGNGTAWEVGLGTIGGSGPYTLARTTVFSSSNSNAAINLSGTGTTYVFADLPASIVQQNLLPGGGATTTSATSITLTTGQAVNQGLNFTSKFCSVTLPNATGLSPGSVQFSLANKGQYPFGVLREDGTMLTAVYPGGTADVRLETNSTAAGVWHVTGQNTQPLMRISETVVPTQTYFFGMLVGSVAVFYYTASSQYYVVAYNPTSHTMGSPVSIGSGSYAPQFAGLTSTTFLAAWNNGSTTYAEVISVSGTTLTVGTTSNDTGLSINEYWHLTPLTSTTVLVTGYSSSNGETFAYVFSVSGMTVTYHGGTGETSFAANSIAQVSSSLCLVYSTSSSYVWPLSISGTTITAGTPTTISIIAQQLLPLTDSLFVVAYSNSSTIEVQAVSIAGTTLTTGTAVTDSTISLSSGSVQNIYADGTSAFFVQSYGSSVYYLTHCTLSGTTTTVDGNSSGIGYAQPYLIAPSTFVADPDGIVKWNGTAFYVDTETPLAWRDCTLGAPHLASDGSGGVIGATGPVMNSNVGASYLLGYWWNGTELLSTGRAMVQLESIGSLGSGGYIVVAVSLGTYVVQIWQVASP